MKRTIAAVSTAAVLAAVAGVAGLGMPERSAVAEGVVAAAEGYSVDPVHSSVVFSIKHAGIANFYGRFNELKGTFHIDRENPSESTFSAEIPIESVDTNNEGRDKHLKAADFFNMRQYPTASFVSTGLSETDEEGVYDLTGRLTLHGTDQGGHREAARLRDGELPREGHRGV
jgi:polyisoprenoid-binding protein YceI